MEEEINPLLIASIIQVESSWNPKAVSNKGACGLMQVVPKWNPKKDGSLYTCEELKNPVLNIKVGTKALRRWNDKSGGHTSTAICAYNAGNVCFKRIRTGYLHKVQFVYFTLMAMLPMNM
jgi:soluble lytic murein transglycosylase-like protein